VDRNIDYFTSKYPLSWKRSSQTEYVLRSIFEPLLGVKPFFEVMEHQNVKNLIQIYQKISERDENLDSAVLYKCLDIFADRQLPPSYFLEASIPYRFLMWRVFVRAVICISSS
jgi:hypothetical protein